MKSQDLEIGIAVRIRDDARWRRDIDGDLIVEILEIEYNRLKVQVIFPENIINKIGWSSWDETYKTFYMDSSFVKDVVPFSMCEVGYSIVNAWESLF